MAGYSYITYATSYFMKNNESSSHFHRTLKYQDAFPAICFVLGMATKYDDALSYVGMTRRDSLNFIGNGRVVDYDSKKIYPLWDTAAIKNVAIEEQLNIFKSLFKFW